MKKINTKVSKKVTALVLAAAAACSLMGCKVEKTVTITNTTEEVEGVGDVIEDTGYAIFDNDAFSFQYDPEYFVVMEDEEYVTVSFYNEGTQTAGSNVIMFAEVENADAMEVAKSLAKQYGVDEGSVQEMNLGGAGATGYSFTIFPTGEEVGENQIRTMGCAVVDGDNVITIEVLTHVEPDEGMDMFINDKIAEVLDTFTVD